ncbi:hypothetical protein [Deinococcus petrolearius]|uniref:Uncharacterized protein n=1 Tax=Deinococcus petrolearius TaxID=1751295 RepID=A0ABW1DL05_9DEIO
MDAVSQERSGGVVCLTREELAAGRPVSREVAFAPEYLETATDEELAARIVTSMRPVVTRLGRWEPESWRLTRTGRTDACGNRWVILTLIPQAK